MTDESVNNDDNNNTPPNVSWVDCFLPCSGGWFLLWFCAIWMLGAPWKFLDDGAVARHIATGRDIIASGQIPHTNYVWAIDPHAHWVTHELFADLALGGAYMLGGLNAVSALTILVTGLCLMWSFQIARERGMGRVSGWLILLPVLIATSVHWLARGHIFSYPFFLFIYYLIYVAPVGAFKKRAIITALTMCIWSNFHGSVGIGLFMLFLKPTCEMLAARFKLAPPTAVANQFWLAGIGAVATAMNIRGMEFFSYLFGYVTSPAIMGKSGEWRQIDFSFGIAIWCFVAVFLALMLAFVYSPKRPKFAELVLCFALFVAGLNAMRLIPYFVLVALPAMGPCVQALRERFAFLNFDDNKPVEPLVATLRQTSLKMALLFGLFVYFMSAPDRAQADFPPARLPVAAMNYVESHKVQGLGFYFDNWGPYVYFRQHKPIFVDEKTDFYPIGFIEEYHKAYTEGDPSVLDKYKIAWVMVPPKSALPAVLAKDPHWKQVYSDKTAVIFERSVTSSSASVTGSSASAKSSRASSNACAPVNLEVGRTYTGR